MKVDGKISSFLKIKHGISDTASYYQQSNQKGPC